MEDRGMQFEERKKNMEQQGREYSRGGGGDGPSGFFSVRTNVYSRQCYSDPNNPGKMICKETNNQSGFDPFNKESNYQNVKENVYTHEIPGFNSSNLSNSSDTDYNSSFFGKIASKFKGLFSEDEYSNNTHNSINKFEYDPYEKKDPYNKNDRKNLFTQHNKNNYDPNDNGSFSNFSENNEWRHEPHVDQFDRIFRAMQNEFIKSAFFDSEDYENEMFNPFAGFFQQQDENYPHHHSFNFSHGHPSLERDLENEQYKSSHRNHHNTTHFHPGKESIHYRAEKEFSDKIYDV